MATEKTETMYQPQVYGVALALMLGSMFCWGSWANTLKLTPGWPFQLFYWDYVLGVVAAALLWGFTLGSSGSGGLPFVADLAQADRQHLLLAIAGGAVFNVANLLLVTAIEIAGLAIAFPVGIGLALVIGVLLNYVLEPKGNAILLGSGVLLVALAIMIDARAYFLRESSRSAPSHRGVLISIACGVLMGSFYPMVAKAETGAHSLGPYAVAAVFSVGVALSALIANTLFMRRPLTQAPPVLMQGYAAARPAWHVWGWIGGAIWCTGIVFNLVASHANIVGPAVSYAIGQGATIVSALWGVLVWREFAHAPPAARRMLWPMFLCFAAGLGLVAIVPLSVASADPPAASSHEKIIIDTDVGTDIDDAFAVALALRSPELDVLGFTTASGDTNARAKILDRMLGEVGRGEIPVAAGQPTRLPNYIPGVGRQSRYGDSGRFAKSSHPLAADFILQQIGRFPDQITLVAIGPLTNVGAVIDKDPAAFRKLKRVVMMGGAIAPPNFGGFGSLREPAPEYNILGDIPAAQKLFKSGVSIYVMPLDSTANLQLDEVRRDALFAQSTPLTDSLTLLYHLWGSLTPVLYDPMALGFVIDPKLCPVEPMRIRVDDQGVTRKEAGAPNAQVCLRSDANAFLDFYMHRLVP